MKGAHSGKVCIGKPMLIGKVPLDVLDFAIHATRKVEPMTAIETFTDSKCVITNVREKKTKCTKMCKSVTTRGEKIVTRELEKPYDGMDMEKMENHTTV